MPVNSEALQDMGFDVENRLHNIMKKSELEKLLNKMVSKMNMREIAKLLCDEKYFSLESLLTVIEKTDKKKFMALLDEPANEREMAIPIIRELNKQGYKVAQEVPLPKTGRAKPRKMDVAGYRKKGLRKKISVIGFELKVEQSRGAIDKAFSQARDYLDYCEQVVVAFSPLMYLKYFDVINSKAEKERDVGVWIVGKSDIVLQIKPAYAQEIDDREQQTIVDYIEKGKTKR